MKLKPTTRTYLVTISTDEDIFDLYPNFWFSWSTPDQFISHIAREIKHIADDGTFGYTISVKPYSSKSSL